MRAAALLIAAAWSCAAHADPRGNQLAYNYAMRCFVAGGILAGDMRRRGDQPDRIAATSRYGKKAFDLAYQVGGVLGFSKKQISADLDSFQRTEARRLVLESGYMDATWADCAKLDLMMPLQ